MTSCERNENAGRLSGEGCSMLLLYLVEFGSTSLSVYTKQLHSSLATAYGKKSRYLLGPTMLHSRGWRLMRVAGSRPCVVHFSIVDGILETGRPNQQTRGNIRNIRGITNSDDMWQFPFCCSSGYYQSKKNRFKKWLLNSDRQSMKNIEQLSKIQFSLLL